MRSARNDQGQVEEAESVAGSERNAVIRHRIEEAVGHAAWNMACILDLEGEPEAGEV